MDEARFEHPLSTLSASIEHPLKPGGDHVEKRWSQSYENNFIYAKIAYFLINICICQKKAVPLCAKLR